MPGIGTPFWATKREEKSPTAPFAIEVCAGADVVVAAKAKVGV